MTGHGFRGVASTILHEQAHRHDIIELQLAHQERDEVSTAYNFATYLPQRRQMMQPGPITSSSYATGPRCYTGLFLPLSLNRPTGGFFTGRLLVQNTVAPAS